jgi:hypothetical protein
MPYCYSKLPYVAWKGDNMTEVLDFFDPWLQPGSGTTVAADGDDLAIGGYVMFAGPRTFPLGTVFVGIGVPQTYTQAEFEQNYDALPVA